MAIRTWSTYELVGQSERSLQWFFPRAERGVYREAKRLAGWGWAEATTGVTGLRQRTVYRITDAGRAALVAWMARDCAPTQISSEAALKVFLGDQAPPGVLGRTVAGVRDTALTALAALAAMATEQSSPGAPFPERALSNALAMRLIADIHRAVFEWSRWAQGALVPLDETDDPAAAALAAETFRGIADDLHRATGVTDPVDVPG
jgi:hypothetical protein